MTTTTKLQHLHDNDSPTTGSCCDAMHDEIAMAAYHNFVKRGHSDGNDVQNWLDAEAHVKAKHANEKHTHHEHHYHAGL